MHKEFFNIIPITGISLLLGYATQLSEFLKPMWGDGFFIVIVENIEKFCSGRSFKRYSHISALSAINRCSVQRIALAYPNQAADRSQSGHCTFYRWN
jgi:hypothetical protein